MYSALSLVSLYHDSIISRRLKQIHRLPASPFRKSESPEGAETTEASFPDEPLAEATPLGQSLPLPSDHTRYTSHFARTSGVYKTAGRALVVLGYVQLLLEMVVVRGRRSEEREGGRWRRWKVLVWLEAVKYVFGIRMPDKDADFLCRTALRLSILLTTRRPLLAFPLPQREIDPSVLAQPDIPTSPATPSTPHLLSIPPGTTPHAALLPLLPLLPEPYQPPAETLLPILHGWREYLGEAMTASEGLVAVMAFTILARRRRRRAAGSGTGMASLARENIWTSLAPLGWTLLARTLRRGGGKSGTSNPMAQLMGVSNAARGAEMTPLLAETYAARDRALLFHFVRGALWQRWTRGKVMRVVGGLERLWGVRLVAGIIRDHVDLVDEYYYCESGRSVLSRWR